MDLFNEEHEEQYWQQVYATRSNGIDRTAILYHQPSRKEEKHIKRNIKNPGKTRERISVLFS